MVTKRENLTQQVFVAYAYNLYDKKDYRRLFSNLEKAYGVKFIFADEKITNMHILQKIISYIRGSDFSLFDISSWNPNVTLELGIALAMSDDWYICFNPDNTKLSEVPSDIRGIDRIQYSGFTDLEDKLTVLLEQWYPKSNRVSIDEYFETIESDVIALLGKQPGLKANEIGEIMNINKKMAQTVVRQMLEKGTLVSEGKTRATKYYITE